MASTYYAQILTWDWDDIVGRARSAAYHRLEKCSRECDGNGHAGFVFLGRMATLAPSGKFYTPDTTHQTGDDVERDSRWEEALDRAATRFGGFISLADDHDDDELFFVRYWTAAQLN